MLITKISVFSAHGNPQITIASDALVFYDGTVVWKPPAIYNSFCLVISIQKCILKNVFVQINIEYFPYDQQICDLKFGGWTYTGEYLTMDHIGATSSKPQAPCPPKKGSSIDFDADACKSYLDIGMDMSNYQL